MIPFYDVIENFHICAGIGLNLLLMFAIYRFSVKTLGAYKHLLLMFAAYDTFLIILHAILKQRVFVVEKTIFGAAAGWDSRIITSFYASCNTVPFVLLIIDFLYRYLCISRPHLLSLFTDVKFIAFLIIITVAGFFSWYIVCMCLLTGEEPEIAKNLLRAESKRRLGKEMKEGWLIMNYWENNEMNVRIFNALMIFDAILFGSLAAALTLGALTYYHIYVLCGAISSGSISVHSLAVQRKLFLSVCAQTAVPFFLVYIPYICVLNLPFLNLPVFFWDDACMLLTSCFPAWDALLVLAFMPDYFQGLLRMVWKKSPKKSASIAPLSMTTMVHNS